jgi:hypothetical protein
MAHYIFFLYFMAVTNYAYCIETSIDNVKDLRTNKADDYIKLEQGYFSWVPFARQYGNPNTSFSPFAMLNILIDPNDMLALLPGKIVKEPLVRASILFHIPTPGLDFSKPINMRFHPFASLFAKNKTDFKFDINIGIFNPQNVETKNDPSYLPFNSVKPQEVHVHPGGNNSIAFSPNNTRITLTTSSSIATCISYAAYKDIAILTYHVFLIGSSELASTIPMKRNGTIAIAPGKFELFLQSINPKNLQKMPAEDNKIWQNVYVLLNKSYEKIKAKNASLPLQEVSVLYENLLVILKKIQQSL